MSSPHMAGDQSEDEPDEEGSVVVKDEPTEEGPSTTSPVKEERIAARRLRIQQRQEAIKKQGLVEGEEELSTKQTSAIEYQIGESWRNLEKIMLEGKELVTNVRVAADMKEKSRLIEEEKMHALRRHRLKKEASHSATVYNEINQAWDDQKKMFLPMEMKQRLKQQTDMCNDLLGQKDQLIAEMEEMLEAAQIDYSKNMDVQKTEINLAIERIEEHLSTMKKAYREELGVIDTYAMTERKSVMMGNKKKLAQAFRRLDSLEKGYVDKKLEVRDLRNAALHDIYEEDAEAYRHLKIQLEGDYMALERQLYHMKAVFLLNTEKLDYNHRILKKRDEENTIMKSHQKRRLNKLHDIAHDLQLKLAAKEKQRRQEAAKEIDEILRLHRNILQTENKAKIFRSQTQAKFMEMWTMLSGLCTDLLTKLLSIERVIHEQQLGLDWIPPDLGNLDIPARTEGTQPSNTSYQGDSSCGKSISSDTSDIQEYRKPLLRHILDLLCYQAGFLMEDRLEELLKGVERNDANLVRMEATFSALRVVHEDDIHLLAKYFLRYTERPHSYSEFGKLICGFCTCPFSQCECPQVEMRKAHSIEELKDLYINPNYILTAIQEFLADHYEQGEGSEHSHVGSSMTSSRYGSAVGVDYFDTEMVTEYFDKFYNFYTEEKESLWNALSQAFEQFSKLLVQRATLLKDCGRLRKQNLELQNLLGDYIHSKANDALVIPPTMLLELMGKPVP